MKNHLLILGIIFLFISSVVAPMTSGINIRTFENTTNLKNFISPFKNPSNDIWNKTFGGSGADAGYFLQQTNDNGYIITAWVNKTSSSYGDIWLIKTDENGDMEWDKTFGGIYEDVPSCVRQTSDGGFVIVGYYGQGYDGPFEPWIIKTDNNGNLEWDKKFSGPVEHTFGECIIELDDGYLIMATLFFGFPDYTNDIWLIKTDFNGTRIWDKFIGESSGDDMGNSVIQTSDGDFLIVGWAYGGKGEVVVLIKTDSNGNKLWRKTYEGRYGCGVFETDDNCYMISAGSASDAYIIKTDSDGNELWTKWYRRSYSYWCDSFAQTSDNGYVVAGTTAINNFDVIIFKIDENGNKYWEKTIGGAKRDVGICVVESNDGNYVIVGETTSYGAGGNDVWLIKMPVFENQRPNKPSTPVGPTNCRPFTDYTFSTSSYDPDGEQLIYFWDWDDNMSNLWYGPYDNNETCMVERGWFLQGTYNIRVKAKDIYGGVSDWSDPLSVTVPRDKAVTNNMLLLRILERFPLLERLLNIGWWNLE